MIGTKVRLFPSYPTSSRLLVSKDSISRFSSICLALFVHRTVYSFRHMDHRLQLFHSAQPSLHNSFKTWKWSVRSNADDNMINSSPKNTFNGRTRLIKVINQIRINLLSKITALREDLPMKLMFFLVGFYCATAYATVIGQTGDWDILSAALAVAIVEGIGALMYKFSLSGRIKSLITMFNYWKAGLSLGLFLDSFKY